MFPEVLSRKVLHLRRSAAIINQLKKNQKQMRVEAPGPVRR
jgi:hypothetical protein